MDLKKYNVKLYRLYRCCLEEGIGFRVHIWNGAKKKNTFNRSEIGYWTVWKSGQHTLTKHFQKYLIRGLPRGKSDKRHGPEYWRHRNILTATSDIITALKCDSDTRRRQHNSRKNDSDIYSSCLGDIDSQKQATLRHGYPPWKASYPCPPPPQKKDK